MQWLTTTVINQSEPFIIRFEIFYLKFIMHGRRHLGKNLRCTANPTIFRFNIIRVKIFRWYFVIVCISIVAGLSIMGQQVLAFILI